jgi:hypothetical protein
MTSIDPRAHLLAAIRAQVASVGRSGPGATIEGAKPLASGSPGAATNVLAQRLRALDPLDADRPRRAVRLYLESELVREFGDAVLNDPSFLPMLEAVHAQMQEDPQIAAAAAALGQWLVEQHPP